MQTATSPDRPQMADDRKAYGVAAGGSMVESLGGLAVMALAVLALVGVLPALLTAIGGIVFGAAMLVEGGSIAGEYSRLNSRIAESSAASLGGGSGVEMLVGIATIALGVLSLLGVSSSVLLPALIITGGVGLILSAGTMTQLGDLHLMTGGYSMETRHVAHGALSGTAAAQTLAGIAATVLGILSLVAVPAAAAAGIGTLPQVGLLVLGGAIALSGGVIGGRMGRLYRRS